jgi:hypothetical protein
LIAETPTASRRNSRSTKMRQQRVKIGSGSTGRAVAQEESQRDRDNTPAGARPQAKSYV